MARYLSLEKARMVRTEVYCAISDTMALTLQLTSPSCQGYWRQYTERSNVTPISRVAMSAQASVKMNRLVEVLMEMFLKMTMQTMLLPSVPVIPINT